MRRIFTLGATLAALTLAAPALAACGGDGPSDGVAAPSGQSPDGGAEAGGDSGSAGGGAAGGGSGGSGAECAVISVAKVSEILGEAYVATPTGIEGAAPDGSYTQDGLSGVSCLFSPADGDVHDLSITTFDNAGDLYDQLIDGEGGTPVNNLGTRAHLIRDEIEVTIIAESGSKTVAAVVLTNLDGSSVEDKVVEITRIVLGG